MDAFVAVARVTGLVTALESNPLQYSTIPQYPPPFYSNKVVCSLRGGFPTVWDPVLGLWLTVTGRAVTGVSNSDRVTELPIDWNDFIPYTPQQSPAVVKTVEPVGDYAVGTLNLEKFKSSGASDDILRIVENGIFTGISGSHIRNRKHDKTVLENWTFTQKLLDRLADNGLLKWVDVRPHACFPLKFARKESGDPRLCVDMHTLKFRLQKLSVVHRSLYAVEQSFTKNCWYLKYDLKNGYWHLKWEESEQLWCGGSFGKRYFVWPVALMVLE